MEAAGQNFGALMIAAREAGLAALRACEPVPMVVVEADVFSGKPKPGAQQYFVEGGPCGFAWISFPGNSPFGRYAKKVGIASKGYPKGLQIWVSEGGQSMARKEAYAHAFVKVLREAGVEKVYANSRMD